VARRRALVFAAVVLAACAHDDDPATWVKRLDDPARQADAVARLAQMRGDGGANDDVILPALAAAYDRDLAGKAKGDAMAALAAARDARAEPAYAKALEECKGFTKAAADAVAALGKVTPRTSKALFACFSSGAPSPDADAQRALHDAVMAVRDPTWVAAAIAIVETPADARDFRQSTSIELLGALHDDRAAHALVSVLMTREKLSLRPVVNAALTRVPRAATTALTHALDGSDFADAHGAWSRDDAYVASLVDALADVGTDPARDAILDALPKMTRDANVAAAAEALTRFPTTPAIVRAFEAAYTRLPAIEKKGATSPGIERAALLQAAGDLYDAHVPAWALASAHGATGEMMLAAKASAIQSALKLIAPGDEKLLADAVVDLETKSGLSPAERGEVGNNLQAVVDYASKALARCKVDVGCYLAIVDEPIPPDSHANWKAIKAATMCGLLGDDATRKKLVTIAKTQKNPGVRLAIARAIAQLAPRGDDADAAALEAIASGESEDDPIARTARMLRARSEIARQK
jgi:hypothetical protein